LTREGSIISFLLRKSKRKARVNKVTDPIDLGKKEEVETWK